MSNTISRPHLIAAVADHLPPHCVDDLPAIRQAINDTADGYRKDGWSVREFDQDGLVRAVQRRIKDKAIEFYCRNRETT